MERTRGCHRCGLLQKGGCVGILQFFCAYMERTRGCHRCDLLQKGGCVGILQFFCAYTWSGREDVIVVISCRRVVVSASSSFSVPTWSGRLGSSWLTRGPTYSPCCATRSNWSCLLRPSSSSSCEYTPLTCLPSHSLPMQLSLSELVSYSIILSFPRAFIQIREFMC